GGYMAMAMADVLRTCFTDVQWDWLLLQPSFYLTLEIDTLKTLDDVERIVKFGDNLIVNAEHQKDPIHPPPKRTSHSPKVLSESRSGRFKMERSSSVRWFRDSWPY